MSAPDGPVIFHIALTTLFICFGIGFCGSLRHRNWPRWVVNILLLLVALAGAVKIVNIITINI